MVLRRDDIDSKGIWCSFKVAGERQVYGFMRSE